MNFTFQPKNMPQKGWIQIFIKYILKVKKTRPFGRITLFIKFIQNARYFHSIRFQFISWIHSCRAGFVILALFYLFNFHFKYFYTVFIVQPFLPPKFASTKCCIILISFINKLGVSFKIMHTGAMPRHNGGNI